MRDTWPVSLMRYNGKLGDRSECADKYRLRWASYKVRHQDILYDNKAW